MRKPIAILSTTVAFLSLEVPRSGFLARLRSTPMGAMRLGHLSAPHHQSIPLWIPG
jgi:hypothetical protein